MIAPEKLKSFIQIALAEDVGSGDHSTLACIPKEAKGKAKLVIKGNGILAGVKVAEAIFRYLEPEIVFLPVLSDGAEISKGQIAFEVEGHVHTILKGERLVLNCMQRMSGIATLTDRYLQEIEGYPSVLLDTRKTTPNFRMLEKEAVLIGGGHNHRMGLYDMIMLKDNHIDFCGGIKPAIQRANEYLKEKGLDIPIEVEVRNMEEVKEVLETGMVNRIMLDNFKPREVAAALRLIDGAFETEASGNIDLSNILDYARTGIDFISAGAIIHQAKSFDLSLKAE